MSFVIDDDGRVHNTDQADPAQRARAYAKQLKQKLDKERRRRGLPSALGTGMDPTTEVQTVGEALAALVQKMGERSPTDANDLIAAHSNNDPAIQALLTRFYEESWRLFLAELAEEFSAWQSTKT